MTCVECFQIVYIKKVCFVVLPHDLSWWRWEEEGKEEQLVSLHSRPHSPRATPHPSCWLKPHRSALDPAGVVGSGASVYTETGAPVNTLSKEAQVS